MSSATVKCRAYRDFIRVVTDNVRMAFLPSAACSLGKYVVVVLVVGSYVRTELRRVVPSDS